MGTGPAKRPPKKGGPFVLATPDLIVSKVTLQSTVPPTVTVVLKNTGNTAFPKPGLNEEDHAHGFRIGVLFIDPLPQPGRALPGSRAMSCHTNAYAHDFFGPAIAAGAEQAFEIKLPTTPDPPRPIAEPISITHPPLTLGTGWWLVVIPNMLSALAKLDPESRIFVNNWYPPADEWRTTNNALVAFVTSLDVVIENPGDK